MIELKTEKNILKLHARTLRTSLMSHENGTHAAATLIVDKSVRFIQHGITYDTSLEASGTGVFNSVTIADETAIDSLSI